MTALRLEELTWPQVRAEIDAGRQTVVVPFGAVEQHGPHLPLGTDALFGDEIGWALAERLDAFLAPTVRAGCSSHHLAFAGTISLREETFRQVAADIVASLAQHGFKRIVLLPTHGGNFRPLGEAVAQMPPLDGVQVITFPDVSVLLGAILPVASSLGITPQEGGVHAGEWETSMVLALRPELVHMDRGEAGYVGDLMAGVQRFFQEGVHTISENGVFGDPRRASEAAGRQYIDHIVDVIAAMVDAQSQRSGAA
ncbi:MAG: creatininase family protein [Dehalococcoidia bacterium]|nr:creatininase family protein [Dehalococcoidia bacterium]